MIKDLVGEALSSYYFDKKDYPLIINNKYGEPEEMGMDVFFRDINDLPDIEEYTLQLSRGRVLDIGAGAGSHSLILQEKGMLVTALEKSPKGCEVMKARGIKDVVNDDIFNFKKGNYDTLILLMNGIGLAGTLLGFRKLLGVLRQLINPNGQVIFDTSDISYVYQDMPKPKKKYFGELEYQFQYLNRRGDWFNWLYLDPATLQKITSQEGWYCQILYQDDLDHYLVRLVSL